MASDAPGRERLVNEVSPFDLSELTVDERNLRLGPNPDQPSAIRAMIAKQRGKLVVLARSILDDGLSPGEPIWVAPDPNPERKGKYVVAEGNRRVTALKLMNEPALADGTSWAKAFKELGKEFADKPVRTVRATLFGSLEETDKWVERRHTNDQDGRGLEPWDSDHKHIAEAVGTIKQKWIVSYDNAEPIQKLYEAYDQQTFDLQYTAATRRKGTEIMVFCDGLLRPDEVSIWRGIAA